MGFDCSSHNKDARERAQDCLRGNPRVPIPNALNTFNQRFIFEEQKRGGCSSWADSGNRDGHSRDIRDNDDGQHDLMRIIGISPLTHRQHLFLSPLP
jgi:hypothetical protein